MAVDDRPPDQSRPPAAPALPRFRFSTDWLPAGDRVPFCREELAKVVSLDLTPLGEAPPRYAMDFMAAGPVGLGRYQGSPTRYVRDRRHLQDNKNDFMFGIFTRGWEAFTYRGGAARVETGDGFLMHNGLEMDGAAPEGVHLTSLTIDAAVLHALVRNPDRASLTFLPRSHGGLSLLRGYLEAFSVSQDTLSPALVHTFGLHVIDLVASILGATRDGAARAAAGGVKAARLREVLSAIAARACDPLFTVEAMAAQLAVTARYVHRVLEDTGGSFSEHVVERRLRRAWSLLSDPAARHLKIASIAYECGFRDLSHFNRAFRRRFGETPTAVRGAAAAGAPGDSARVSPLAVSLASH